MAAKLDRTKPYGTIHGSSYGACYAQDHKEFDNDGNEISTAKVKAAVALADAQKPAGPTVTKDGQGNLFVDGEIIDIEDKDVEYFRGLAKEMGMSLHKQVGKAKALAAIMDAAGPHDQLQTQMD